MNNLDYQRARQACVDAYAKRAAMNAAAWLTGRVSDEQLYSWQSEDWANFTRLIRELDQRYQGVRYGVEESING